MKIRLDIELWGSVCGVFCARIVGLGILILALRGSLAFSQKNPPGSEVSPLSRAEQSPALAAERREQSPDSVLNDRNTAVNAIPEERAPQLVDAAASTAPGVSLDGSEPTVVLARLIEQGKFEEVEPLLVDYLKEMPSSWRAHYLYGYVLFRRHRLTDSMKEIAKSLELNTGNADAHKVLGRIFGIVGRYDLALREFDEAQRLTPNSVEVYYDRGRIFSMQDDFHRAKSDFETAVRIDPRYMEAFNALGFTLEALGDDPAAFANYNEAVQLNETNHKQFGAPYVNLSGYYRRRGDFQAALAYAQKALELNPKSDLAWYQMAKTYRTMGDWPHTAEALEKAIGMNASSAQYHYVLSIAYRKLGRNKESAAALAEFRKIEEQTASLESQRREARRAKSLKASPARNR